MPKDADVEGLSKMRLLRTAPLTAYPGYKAPEEKHKAVRFEEPETKEQAKAGEATNKPANMPEGTDARWAPYPSDVCRCRSRHAYC